MRPSAAGRPRFTKRRNDANAGILRPNHSANEGTGSYLVPFFFLAAIEVANASPQRGGGHAAVGSIGPGLSGPAGGRLRAESIRRTSPRGKLLDLAMLVMPGGQERTEDEYATLLNQAGFQLTRVVPTGSTVSIVEAVPNLHTEG